jgi:fructosamine-3-kinase
VPHVLARGRAGDTWFLALEWIESRPAGREAERRLGEQLAAQHQATAAQFGFAEDNFIGRTSQANGWLPDWAEFFRERRLRHQLVLAAQNGFAALLEQPGARLLEAVTALLDGHRPEASLLHGDLWAGNWLADEHDAPVIFDPAVYYGDREADLAMTRLFGGFGRAFYDAYQAAAPLPAGHAVRAELYNLYHVLNHANLFGGGYARQARTSIDRLLAEVRG